MFCPTRLLLLRLLVNQFVVQAVDAPGIIPYKTRTMYKIVWGCLSTTIICAWAAIHPNIPPREGPFKRTLRKLELMFWAILAPEILPAWALNQRLAAVTIRDVYNEGKGYRQEKRGIWTTLKRWFSLHEIKEVASQAWTLKHGHFLIMGGFHLVEPVEGNSTQQDQVNVQSTSIRSAEGIKNDAEKGQPPSGNMSELEEGRVTILTLEMLKILVNDPEFRIGITDEDISNRSKGDELSKIIYILQSSWFVFGCMARIQQGLGLSQLEVTTLALASLTGITFILWWDKPLGAQAVVRVYMKRKITDAERRVGQRSRSEIIPFTVNSTVTTIRDIVLCQSEANIFAAWLIQLPLLVVALLLSPIITFSLAFIATLYDLLGISTSFPTDATHVPKFYVPQHRYSKSFAIFLLIGLGTIFSGIHGTGWSLTFPTYADQILWRLATIAVVTAAFPLALVVTALLTISKSSSDYAKMLCAIVFIISIVVYASARFVLLALALKLLREQAESTYIAVDWTEYYPHIF